MKNLQKKYRLTKNSQFRYVYRRGKSSSCKELVLLYAHGKSLKVGFSVSKKIGNAVIRNRTKRRLRECFRMQIGSIKKGSYVIIARNAAVDADFISLKNSIYKLLQNQHLIYNKEANK